MKKDVTFIVSFIAIFFMIAVIVLGWYYIFKNTQSESSGSAGADLTIKPVATSTDRSLKISSITVTNSDIQSAFKADNDAVTIKTDTLFKDPGTQSPKLEIKIADPALVKHIETVRKEITQTLYLWRELLKTTSANPTGIAAASTTEKANEYAQTISEYLADLQSAVDSLTPENSGLPKSEIDSYHSDVDDAIKEAEEAKKKLEVPTPDQTGTTPPAGSNSNASNPYIDPSPSTGPTNNTNSNTTPPPPSPTGSSEQPPTSDQSGDPSLSDPSANSDDATSTPPPPIYQPDHSGAPRLIEGANPIM
jgi:hypothetical protein